MQATPENQSQFEARVAQLTRTQKQVLEMFVQGCDDGAIAASLDVVENTVRQHISRIANKLGIPSDRSDKSFRREEIIKLFRRYAPEQVVSPHYVDEPLSNLISKQLTQSTQDIATTEVEIVDPLSNDPNFVGREEAIATFDNFRERGSKLLQVVAVEGQGKTTLARKYLYARFPQVVEFTISKEIITIQSVESLLNIKLYELGEKPGENLAISIERLKQKIQSTPIGILIDNLETSLDKRGKFVQDYRSYVDLLQILSTPNAKSFTLITSREFLNEPKITLDIYRLQALSLNDWHQYFHHQSLQINNDLLEQIYSACHGIAKAMIIVASQEMSLDVYWQTVFKNPFINESILNNLVFDSVHEIFAKNPEIIKLIGIYGEHIDLTKAKELFNSNEIKLWRQLEQYSLGEWSETGTEFKVYNFFYKEIKNLLDRETKEFTDNLTGTQAQCQAQNQDFFRDIIKDFSFMAEHTSNSPAQNNSLLQDLDNITVAYPLENMLDENITLGCSFSEGYQQKQENKNDSILFNTRFESSSIDDFRLFNIWNNNENL